MKIVKIGKNEAGQRMDKFLKKYLKEAGTGFLYKMLRKKNILLNKKKAEGKEILSQGDEITFYLADETLDKFRGRVSGRPAASAWPDHKLDIVYEDEDVVFLNKPAGMLSQKADPGDVSMVEYLIGYLLKTKAVTEEELETFHPSVCNRLDRNTSGLILGGKTLLGLQGLSELLKDRTMEKYYLCLVRGKIEEEKLCMAYLVKNNKTNQVHVSETYTEGAGYIKTRYIPLWSDGKETLLKVELITGKSHQIRAHLSCLGFPLAGDPKYGNKKWNAYWRETTGLNRQFLHAWEVVFPESMKNLQKLGGKSYKAPLPEDLKKVLISVGCGIKF